MSPGRAILYLQTHDAGPYRDAILCLPPVERRMFHLRGETASDEDILAAALDFLKLKAVQELLMYLRFFKTHRFPLEDFSRLFELAGRETSFEQDSTQHQITRAAFDALKFIEHPAVRVFMLDRMLPGILPPRWQAS